MRKLIEAGGFSLFTAYCTSSKAQTRMKRVRLSSAGLNTGRQLG